MTTLSFGIATAPQYVDYTELLRVWREADTVPAIEHAWVFDHLLPIGGVDRSGPIFEGWTLLSALAAQTRRLRIGTLVTSNRIRPPSVLAKMAATVDIVSGARLEFAIGAGSIPSLPTARQEYEANGLPYVDGKDAVAALDEACTVITRLWTESEPFDFDGAHVRLKGAFTNPKPVQQPHPPIVIGGSARSTLRVVARHADVWNYQRGDLEDGIRRGRMLDEICEQIGRDPATIVRSTVGRVDYEHPDRTREQVERSLAAGFTHLVLSVPAPYPQNVAQWVATEIIDPFLTKENRA